MQDSHSHSGTAHTPPRDVQGVEADRKSTGQPAMEEAQGWLLRQSRSFPVVILLAGLVLFFALHPLDAKVDAWLSGMKLGGDLRREWHAWMQYGQGTCLAVTAVLIWQLSPRRRRILLPLGLSLVVMGIAVTVMKWMIGRPRPVLGDPDRFVGPLGAYPLTMADGSKVLVRAWQISHDRVEQLWSMPSSHTAFAFCLSTFLAIHFPAIRWLVVFLACVVASGRLVFDAHYLTDVVVGAAVSIAATVWVHQMRWHQAAKA